MFLKSVTAIPQQIVRFTLDRVASSVAVVLWVFIVHCPITNSVAVEVFKRHNAYLVWKERAPNWGLLVSQNV